MTTSFVTVVHCDFPRCDLRADQTDDKTMPPGWTSAIYTHGCPDHGAFITEHKADVDCVTRRRKDYWYLTCACGWSPTPGWSLWSSAGQKKQHLDHLAAVAVPAVVG